MRVVVPLLALVLLAGCLESGIDGAGDGRATAPSQSGSFGGQVTVLEGERVETFYLDEGHTGLRVALMLLTNLPENAIALNATGPDGRSLDLVTAPILYATPGIVPVDVFDDPVEGDYTLRITLASGTLAEYRVYYCTSGQHHDPSNEACEPY